MTIQNGRGLPAVHVTSDEQEDGKVTIYDADGGKSRALRFAP